MDDKPAFGRDPVLANSAMTAVRQPVRQCDRRLATHCRPRPIRINRPKAVAGRDDLDVEPREDVFDCFDDSDPRIETNVECHNRSLAWTTLGPPRSPRLLPAI